MDGRAPFGQGGFGPGYGPGYGPYFFHHHDGGGHPLAWILFFLLLALVVALVTWLVLRLADGRLGQSRRLVVASGPQIDDPLTAVRMRYARGEIDRKEFLRVSSDLGGPPEQPGAEEAPTVPG
jgi:uncharacterized membrane protein